jgi:hypothetical protein
VHLHADSNGVSAERHEQKTTSRAAPAALLVVYANYRFDLLLMCATGAVIGAGQKTSLTVSV